MPAQRDADAVQQRQKRQRRMTAGGGKPAAAPAEPAAVVPTAASATTSAPDAWQQWLCPGNPAMWAFTLALAPLPARFRETLQTVHPQEMFPEHYPHALPPGMSPWAALWQVKPGAAAPQPVQLALLQPKDAKAVVAAAASAAAAAAAPPSQKQQQQRQQQGGAAPASCDCSDCSSGGVERSRRRSAGAEDSDSDTESDDGSYGGCCCSDCCARYGLHGYCSSSPESERVAPGKRITWRGAIPNADPVRRNLFPSLTAAAAAPAPERPQAEERQLQP